METTVTLERLQDESGTHALWDGDLPTLGDVFRARRVIARHLAPTPLIEAEKLSDRIGVEAYVKCENLQPTGAFKVRGGLYLLSRLSEEQRARGVVGASTGNHGQSIAYAARAYGAKATIFVPEVANELKVASMERLGATVVKKGADFNVAFEAARASAEEQGAHFIHSANEPDLIAGVATASLEMLEEVPDLDAVFVPIGGGSGLCGATLVGKSLNPALQVIGVQSEEAPVVYESWRYRELKTLDRCDTFAEGIATRAAFSLPAAMLWNKVDEIMLVSDADLRRSILTLLETTAMLAEGAGAAALAGLYDRRHEFAGKKVGIILSGGNLTLESLQEALTKERAW
ncbi:MAG TPA: threonine/serine dehydratase [Thermomicrobiales bacterium]|nr:threonine/serine dehydratase [Thermomicrobiales bacterium]